MVFLFGQEDRDGMATVIYDGEVRGKLQDHRPLDWLMGSWGRLFKINSAVSQPVDAVQLGVFRALLGMCGGLSPQEKG